ncbi:MAG: adenylosuccinate synthetase [Lasallia pustulata]|uniref:Adenylosuccinate synthetase n=1 Tax=Lasallia pustulata TaxID=136370 RepID=A0A5M8PL87_9LECA|nr:MAG: adenylosuccinate synthetase [Lasallia pustulata]
MATVVLGAQWGDEGKGKLVDILCSQTSLCARAQGGNNAGHTIVADGVTYDFHILPSGLVNPRCMNLIGSGCVIHIPSFFKELEELQEKGLDGKGRIVMSERAQVVFDLHMLVDGLEEGELNEAAKEAAVVNGGKARGGEIGTTRKGIGPAYSTKVARSGVRIHHIFDKNEMDKRLRAMAKGVENRYGALGGYDVEEEIKEFDTYREKLAEYVIDAVDMMQDAQNKDMSILIEGANALMLDIDYGTYPYVTSSNTGIGGVFTGLALSPFKIKEIIGVVKAYTTRVGGGPFPTEQLNQNGTTLQTLGREYGVTTGRTRRCGWLDLVVIKYSHAVNHYTSLNLTKLDILDTFASIQVAVAYRLDGRVLESFPADLEMLERCEVVYETLPGWEKATTGAKSYEDLPPRARAYVEFIEERVGVRVKFIGTGPARENMIVRA